MVMSNSEPPRRRLRRQGPATLRGKHIPTTTTDQRLLDWRGSGDWVHTDPWRVLRIQAEFVEGFGLLAELGRAVAVFGSARTPRGSVEYQKAELIATGLAEAGFAIITGGGPGIMEAANKGAVSAGGVSVGLGIELPVEQGLNGLRGRGPGVPLLLRAQADAGEVLVRVRRDAGRVRHAGRAVRDRHPDSDRQDHQVPHRAGGQRLLVRTARPGSTASRCWSRRRSPARTWGYCGSPTTRTRSCRSSRTRTARWTPSRTTRPALT